MQAESSAWFTVWPSSGGAMLRGSIGPNHTPYPVNTRPDPSGVYDPSVYTYTYTHTHTHTRTYIYTYYITYTLPPPRVQEPAMFDRGTSGRFLRTLFPLNLTAEPGVGSCAQPWATPYRGKKIFWRVASESKTSPTSDPESLEEDRRRRKEIGNLWLNLDRLHTGGRRMPWASFGRSFHWSCPWGWGWRPTWCTVPFRRIGDRGNGTQEVGN